MIYLQIAIGLWAVAMVGSVYNLYLMRAAFRYWVPYLFHTAALGFLFYFLYGFANDVGSVIGALFNGLQQVYTIAISGHS